jgi:hypothetical protein
MRFSLLTWRTRTIAVGVVVFALSSQWAPYRRHNVHAFSTGAGGCPAGTPAVSDFHTLATSGRTIDNVPFASSGVVFTINGAAIDPNDPVSIRRSTSGYLFSVKSNATANNTIFRGALIRVEQGDGAGMAFGPSSNNAQAAVSCVEPALGVTHKDAENKTLLTGAFSTESINASITVDVTVVFENSGSVSRYTHEQFIVGVVEADTGPPVNPSTGNSTPTTAPFQEGVGNQTPSIAPVETSPQPTFSEPCYVCGASDLNITLSNVTITVFNNVETCITFYRAGLERLIPPEACGLVSEEVIQNCGCQSINATTPNVAPSGTTNGTSMPSVSSSPSLSFVPSMGLSSVPSATTTPSLSIVPSLSAIVEPTSVEAPIAPPVVAPQIAPVSPPPVAPNPTPRETSGAVIVVHAWAYSLATFVVAPLFCM